MVDRELSFSLPAAVGRPSALAEESRYVKCDGRRVICKSLRKRLQDGYSKGLNSITMFNFATGEEAASLLAYKTSSTDRGIVLNFCPFCGERINRDYVDVENTFRQGAPDGATPQATPKTSAEQHP